MRATARVPFYADWELPVSNYLAGDDKGDRYLYCEGGRCIASASNADAWSKEITSHADFPLAVTWMVLGGDDLQLLGILPPGDASYHRSSRGQLKVLPSPHGVNSIN